MLHEKANISFKSERRKYFFRAKINDTITILGRFKINETLY